MPSKFLFPHYKTLEEEVIILRDKVIFLEQSLLKISYLSSLYRSKKIEAELVELDRLKSSRSWKITKPLRILNHKLNRFKRLRSLIKKIFFWI